MCTGTPVHYEQTVREAPREQAPGLRHTPYAHALVPTEVTSPLTRSCLGTTNGRRCPKNIELNISVMVPALLPCLAEGHAGVAVDVQVLEDAARHAVGVAPRRAVLRQHRGVPRHHAVQDGHPGKPVSELGRRLLSSSCHVVEAARTYADAGDNTRGRYPTRQE